ncbi:tetratricopeptide repeat protein [Marilutibacter alkalisoli]|nr:tetratricopeptide repeat protein [Lysobacter alkalisoli]
MQYDKLDNEELLRLSLEAINVDRDADAVVMLKTLVEREPSHHLGRYLLAAQHAQMGLFDRAEEGFRAVLAQDPGLPAARFQLGQLLVMKGLGGEAGRILQPLTGQEDALGAYARALSAIAEEDRVAAIRELQAGVALPQEIPALAADMQRLLAQLQRDADVAGTAASGMPPHAAPMFMTGYGRQG